MTGKTTWRPIVITRWQVTYSVPSILTGEDRKTFFAAMSYVSLLPPGKYNYSDLARAIQAAADTSIQFPLAAIQVLLSLPDA
jgi:hypothetical protein